MSQEVVRRRRKIGRTRLVKARDFWWRLAYDPAVVVVTYGDVVRDGRGVWLSAPLGRLGGLGL